MNYRLTHLYIFLLFFAFFGITTSAKAQTSEQLEPSVDSTNVDSMIVFASKNWRAQPKLCLRLAKKVSNMSHANRDTTSYGWSLNFRGVLFAFSGNMDSSFYYYDSSVVFSKANNLEQNLLKSTMNLAINHQMQGNYQLSLDNFYAVLEIFEKKGDSVGIAHSYGGMGNDYFNLGSFDKAEELYLKSIVLYEALGGEVFTAAIYANLGVIYRDRGEIKQAEEAFEKSIPLLEATQQVIPLALAYVNIAVLYHQSDLEKALEYYDKSIKIHKELNNELELGVAYVGKGEAYQSNHKDVKSILWLRKAIPLLTNKESYHKEMLLYQRMSIAFEHLNKADSALFYFRKQMEIDRRISGNSVKEKVAELEISYDTEKKEKQLAEQNVQLAKQETEAERRKAQLLLIIAVVVFLLAFGIALYYRQRIKQEKLQQQIALEKVEADLRIREEKLRISRDLHDNIGSQLTFMISTLDNLTYIKEDAAKLEKMNLLQSFAQDTMRQLRETIWAMKSEEIELDQMISKVAEFVDKAKLACPDIDFLMESNSEVRSFNSNEAIHVFRTIQEALNNAVKYANSTQVVLKFTKDVIQIVDNGVGFDLNTVQKGNGLINMKHRITELGHTFDLSSSEKNGTTVSIRFNK